MSAQQGRTVLTLITTAMLATALGTVHAFSVFLLPLEKLFAASRADVSLTYSIALVSLTCGVALGPRVFSRLPAAWLVSAICLTAAAGLALAAMATGIVMVWVGYGVVFSAANGLGYGYALQLAGQTRAGREGITMGLVTAAYAFGAVLSPPVLTALIFTSGASFAFGALAVTLVILAPVCAAFLAVGRARWRAGSRDAKTLPIGEPGSAATGIIRLWIGYGAGVAAGLMTIGHAEGISRSLGLDGPGWIAPTTIAGFNLLGSLTAGWLVDRVAARRLLSTLPIGSAVALLLLAGVTGTTVILPALAVVGFAYGGFIAAFPAAIAKRFGAAGPTVYGRIFTAWGAAGLTAPWLAGALFDMRGDYGLSLVLAAGFGLVSGLLFLLERRST